MVSFYCFISYLPSEWDSLLQSEVYDFANFLLWMVILEEHVKHIKVKEGEGNWIA